MPLKLLLQYTSTHKDSVLTNEFQLMEEVDELVLHKGEVDVGSCLHSADSFTCRTIQLRTARVRRKEVGKDKKRKEKKI